MQCPDLPSLFLTVDKVTRCVAKLQTYILLKRVYFNDLVNPLTDCQANFQEMVPTGHDIKIGLFGLFLLKMIIPCRFCRIPSIFGLKLTFFYVGQM